jgi:hypothetical protein
MIYSKLRTELWREGDKKTKGKNAANAMENKLMDKDKDIDQSNDSVLINPNLGET